MCHPSSHSCNPPPFDDFVESGFEEMHSPFLKDHSRRWARLLPLKISILSALFLIVAFTLSFFKPLIPLSYIALVFVYFLAGIPALIDSIEDLLNFEINIDMLMTLAAFLSILIGSSMEGALLLVLFSLSGSIEETVTIKAKGAISGLKHLSPPMAYVVADDGTVFEKSIKDIEVGAHIFIKAGEFIPLDGEIITGTSHVNLVHLTGENLPVKKTLGETVPAGARNIEGTLTVKVTHTSSDSTLSRLIELITKAQEAKPKLQRWIDRASNTYALTIIVLAFLFAVFMPLLFHVEYLGVEGSIYRALAFLVAASPCAIVIAIPIAYLSALSVCAKKGVLLKGGITLDALARCKVLSFDKTGTLTTGMLTLVKIDILQNQENLSEDEVLSIAYALERGAVHPIANAIIDYSQKKRVNAFSIQEDRALPGFGVVATATLKSGKVSLYLGRIDKEAPFELDSATWLKLEGMQKKIQLQGHLLAVLIAGQTVALFQLRDQVRSNMKEILASLKRRFKVIMLTGDHYSSAQSVAKELDIDEFYADLKPEDKLTKVTLLAENEGLAMIGDGINDAPALARATVGISMGQIGSRSAIDASDVVLLHDNLTLLDWLMDKAYATRRIVRQNVGLAAAVILLAIVPALEGHIPLWAAVVLHEGGTILVGLNGLRLLKKR